SYLNDGFFSRLETLALNMKSYLAGFFGGKHLVQTYGQTVEFADYREYMLGDDIRRIDWNLYSRFEKFYLKLFTDERQIHTQIFLDCSASMGKFATQKGAYAVAVAAALGFLSVHNMDKLSIKLIKKDRAEDPFGLIVGKQSFFRAIKTLENVEFDGDANISSAVTGCMDTGSKDGLTVIISDFFTEHDWKKAIDYLCYKKRQVLLIQVLMPEEIDPLYNGRVNLIDSEAADLMDEKNMKLKITRGMQLAYQQALSDMTEDMKRFCASREADFITVNTEKPIEKVLFGELLKTGIMA
ncbi:MAG: DUF58 domain-containing protein, partial [Clostridiales bacterium]|nr:DUF58 domain-containing protein [Clostridiales bacterium]